MHPQKAFRRDLRKFRKPLLFLVLLPSFAVFAIGQKGGNSTSRRGTSVPSSTPSPSTQPSNQTIFIGKVVMDDGSSLPGPVAIVSICNGNVHRETMSMLDGSFSFMPGDRNSSVMADASETDRIADPFSGKPSAMNSGVPSGPVANTHSLFGCELRAEAPGYESSYVPLARETPGNIDVGSLVLHDRKAKSRDAVISATSLQAPASARKDFDKGRSQLDKGKLADAESSFRRAVTAFPRYAEAWFYLGNVRNLQHDPAGARTNYEEALKADPGYPPPYLRLAQLAAISHQWEDTRSFTDRFLALDQHSALGFYYNGAANYNLRRLPQAEASALKAESLDPQHHEPRIEILLGLIYAGQQNYAAAAQHYRTYLQLVPDGPQTAQVKTDLAKLEELAKAANTNPSAPRP